LIYNTAKESYKIEDMSDKGTPGTIHSYQMNEERGILLQFRTKKMPDHIKLQILLFS
jgi:hypothetical protein